MGTVFSFDLRAPGVERAALDDAIAWLHRMDAMFSTYRTDSVISRLGRGELELADCPPEVSEVLDACAALTAATDGYFDAHAGGRLDPSGYVKGWAIERVSDRLAAAGSANHCVNGGGDVQCRGTAAPGRDWQVGIAHSLRPGELVATVAGRTLAVATSGSAERGAHVLDPHTGRSPAALASVTVVGTRLAEVDALATALFAMGERAERFATDRGLRALVVHADGRSTTIGAPAALA
ncbi:MAG TPA: FAD:protein FMN transferase [Jatrophihabitans sp.]|jgi:thiamine biosynthesis lipoprotein|uniref:FAD:protein FMN transferase n=1 Tax=Jatrophihabitans sp. TaxID=1932789 RepID=UPI002E030596|nr:FAD:protein FMN transferase [Jatrophihabitans sp.]